MQYEQRDAFTVLTRKVAEKFEQTMEIEQKLSRLTDQSSALTSLVIMRKCMLAMWEGDLVGKETRSSNRLLPMKALEGPTEEFYKTWLHLFPTGACNRKLYVSGLGGIQIALAYTVYLLSKDYKLTHRGAIQKLAILKSVCSWQHDDPLFTHLYDPTTRRIKNHGKKSALQETARQFITMIKREGNL